MFAGKRLTALQSAPKVVGAKVGGAAAYKPPMPRPLTGFVVNCASSSTERSPDGELVFDKKSKAYQAEWCEVKRYVCSFPPDRLELQERAPPREVGNDVHSRPYASCAVVSEHCNYRTTKRSPHVRHHGATSFNHGATWQTSTAAFFQRCVTWVWDGTRVKFTNTKGEVYVTGKAECC